MFSELLEAQFTVIKWVHVSHSEHLTHSEFHLFHLLFNYYFTHCHTMDYPGEKRQKYALDVWHSLKARHPRSPTVLWRHSLGSPRIIQSFISSINWNPLSAACGTHLSYSLWVYRRESNSSSLNDFTGTHFSNSRVSQSSINLIIHYPYSDTGDT